MMLKSVTTPRGVIVNVSETEAREVFGASEEAIAAARRETQLDAIRAERNRRIAASDWTQLPDAALTAEQKAAWASYRQALRDLPEAAADLDNVVWPVKP